MPLSFSLPTGRRVLLLDAALALWAAAWIAMGVAVASSVDDLVILPDTFTSVGGAIEGSGRAIGALELPVVGNPLRRPGAEVREAGREVASSGRAGRDEVEHASNLLGLAIALIPTLPLLVLYLPPRVGRELEAQALRRTLGESAGDPALERLLAERAAELEAAELDSRLAEDRVDVTLPGDPPRPAGRLHLITETRREIEDVFVGLGFSVVEGPEVELDHYNFTALNMPPDHPARLMQDTFYFTGDALLRTHTSPMQVRSMEAQAPPIYVIVPGKVYRRDSDATHTPMFHQIEGLAVDEDITLADLRGVLLEAARAIFGAEREIRLRASYFPFTEPSVEVDVSCFNCDDGFLRDGSRCPVCRGEGWMEILGAGMVDPNVFGYVREHGYDPERHQGFAWGMGIERIAMLK
nr:phenylalanine--tRNA ligase subunit alpha [Actinomycetota bacterium]